MKAVLWISLFILLRPGIAAGQTDRASDTRGDASATRKDDGREHHNWGWIGLLGLAGLAGLRRKSEMHSQLEAQGVNVKSVRT
jgi:MYXO-CTERM domain-containing protein